MAGKSPISVIPKLNTYTRSTDAAIEVFKDPSMGLILCVLTHLQVHFLSSTDENFSLRRNTHPKINEFLHAGSFSKKLKEVIQDGIDPKYWPYKRLLGL